MTKPEPSTYTFTAEQPERLDIFMAEQLPDHSRSFLQKLCKDGAVTINGDIVTKTGHSLHAGDTVQITFAATTTIHGELPVIYEDDDVIVINKPAGVLSHAKGAANNEFTVAEFMRPRTSDGTATNRPGIVHRLDRGTSGVMIAAKTTEAKRWLQKQFSQRKVKKTYLALVEGTPKQPEAVIKLPIERNPKTPQSFRVGSNGRPAETTYHTEKHFRGYTLLKLLPQTGRTHQLRIHLSHIGHPVVGDTMYGHGEPRLGRLFLHATALEITLPSRQRKIFSAQLPAELQQFMDSLQ